MSHDKLPQDYKPGIVQKIIERVKQSITAVDQKQSQALQDTSRELQENIDTVEERLTKKIDGTAGDGANRSTYVPVPQDLNVFEFGLWGFAYIDPFMRFKYPQTVRGYEFYGSQNVEDVNGVDDFEVQQEPYTQQGVHFGTGTTTSPDEYLNTEDTLGNDTFILTTGLVNLITPLTLENMDTGEKGNIVAYGLVKPRYTIKATGVTWREGDRWRIYKYPKNRLFNIGSLCIFPKRLGNVWIKARAFGKGHSFSGFTAATQSSGLSSTSEIEAPTIVYPIHECGRTCTLDEADDYLPRCDVHGVVAWDEITGGTRQTDHFSFFGFEGCNVELVYNEITDEDVDVLYRAKHQLLNEADPDEVDEQEDDTK
jgi:hypothetical protein